MAQSFEITEPNLMDEELKKNEELKNEEWHKRRLARNARRRERRQERKEEDPEFLKRENEKQQERRKQDIESEKRKERRQKAKIENPESHAEFLLSEKQKRENQHREILNEVFDRCFNENKHTFPFPISKSKWEKLKKEELDWMFVYNPLKLPFSDFSVNSLMDYRRGELEYLRENLDHGSAGSMIFYVKTMVHNAKDQRTLTEEEKEWVKNFHLEEKEIEKPKYIYDQTEYKKEKRKIYYDLEKLCQKTVNLNLRFIKADPNKVLSIDEITNNPYVSNYPIREQHKIDRWKTDENSEDLDLWRKQREAYEMEVEELTIEYKEEFLKNIS